MSRSVFFGLLGSMLLAPVGCGDDGSSVERDAGVTPADSGGGDAGMGTDSGPPDAGPADAGGDVDAGPPGLSDFRATATAMVAEVDTMRDALPTDEEQAAAVLEVDLVTSAVDALLGSGGLADEPGVMSDDTLPSTPSSAPVVATLVLIDEIDRARAGIDRAAARVDGSTPTATAELVAALEACAEPLDSFRAELLDRYQELVAAEVGIGTFTVEEHIDPRWIVASDEPIEFPVRVEGVSTVAESAGIEVDCPATGDAPEVSVRVADFASGTELASTAATGYAWLDAAAPYDELSTLRVRLEVSPPAGMDDATCYVNTHSRRRLSEEPSTLSGTDETDVAAEAAAIATLVGDALTESRRLVTEGEIDATVGEVIAGTIRSDAVAIAQVNGTVDRGTPFVFTAEATGEIGHRSRVGGARNMQLDEYMDRQRDTFSTALAIIRELEMRRMNVVRTLTE